MKLKRLPCAGCRKEGRCDQENDVARKTWLAWLEEKVVECRDREDRFWRGLDGVMA